MQSAVGMAEPGMWATVADQPFTVTVGQSPRLLSPCSPIKCPHKRARKQADKLINRKVEAVLNVALQTR